MRSKFPNISILMFSLCTLLAVLCSGCVKNRFKIKFDLAPKVTENYRLAYYCSDKTKGWMADAVAVVSSGKGDVECATRLPSIVYLFSTSEVPVIAFYAERGDDITISGDDFDPLKWRVGGNKINEQWSDWRIKHAAMLDPRSGADPNPTVQKFVEQNRDNPVALLILMTSYNRRVDPEGFRKLWDSLDEKLREGKWLALFQAADLAAGDVNLPSSIPSSITLLHNPDSTLHISLRDTNRSLFWFKKADWNGRDADADSLKNLFRSRKDTQTRLIAVYTHTDTTSYYSRRDHDSIPFATMAWLPGGVAANQARTLGVPRLPYFILADKKGKVIYRGDKYSDLRKHLK